jgi:DNA-binding phage protein
MTEDELREAADRFRTAPKRALEERDAALQRAAAEGWRQTELARATGFSRETIRQALNPDARAAVRAAEAQRAAAGRRT